jgi:hypothetical protein
MTAFSVCAALFLWLVGHDALQELHPFQFFADSNTYHRTFNNEISFEGPLVNVNANYLGPMAVLSLVQANIYLVMLLNIALFTVSINHVSRLLGLNALALAGVLLLSPITVSSLLSVNKEIFLFPFLAIALHAHVRRRVGWVLAAALCAVLVRWQLLLFYVLLLVLSGPLALTKRRGWVLVGFLTVISIAYRLIHPLIEPILSYVESSFDSYDGGGSGLFEWALAWQNEGYYIAVFPIKAFHLLFGMGLRLDRLLSPVEVYNDLFIGGHCLVALIAFAWLWKQRFLTLRHDLVAVAAMFLAVFCVTPIFAPRYLYFVYVLVALVIAGAPAKLRRASSPLPKRETATAWAAIERGS